LPAIVSSRGMLRELVDDGETGLVIGDTPQDLADAMPVACEADIYGALSDYTSSFDPTRANEAFDVGVADPAQRRLEEGELLDIEQRFSGGDFFSSARGRASERARGRLSEALTSSRAGFISGQEEAHKTRGLSAIKQMTDLYSLPDEVANLKASTTQINAMTAGIFHNMEWTSALNELKMTAGEVGILGALWGLYEPEQMQTQNQINIDMANLFSDSGGFDFQGFLNLMGRYNTENQNVFVEQGGMMSKL